MTTREFLQVIWFSGRSGTEPCVSIRCVNAIDASPPDCIEYVTRRYGNTGRELADAESGAWVSCCECVDDCATAEACACRQLTVDNARRLHPSLRPSEQQLQRLFAHRRVDPGLYQDVGGYLMSGFYECNALCACSRRLCHNRVAQTELKWPLELFKTHGKGWGVRTLVDIPQNEFVCTYAGAMHDDKAAKRIRNDNYFADCDLIATVERAKVDSDIDSVDLIDDSITAESP